MRDTQDVPKTLRKDSKLSVLLHGSLWSQSLLSGESNHVTISTSLYTISLPPLPILSVSLSLKSFLTLLQPSPDHPRLDMASTFHNSFTHSDCFLDGDTGSEVSNFLAFNQY